MPACRLLFRHVSSMKRMGDGLNEPGEVLLGHVVQIRANALENGFALGAFILRLTGGFCNYILSTLFYDAVHQGNSCSSRTPLEGSFHQGGRHDVSEKWADAPDVDGPQWERENERAAGDLGGDDEDDRKQCDRWSMERIDRIL